MNMKIIFESSLWQRKLVEEEDLASDSIKSSILDWGSESEFEESSLSSSISSNSSGKNDTLPSFSELWSWSNSFSVSESLSFYKNEGEKKAFHEIDYSWAHVHKVESYSKIPVAVLVRKYSPCW